MRFAILAATLALAAPALAQGPAKPISAGTTLRSSDMGRVGQIDRVNADGSVQIIFRTKFVTVPASTLSVTDKGEVTTSLTKREIAKLH